MEQLVLIIIWVVSVFLLLIAFILLVTAVLMAHHVGYLLSKPKPLHITEKTSLRRYKRNVALLGLSITGMLLLTSLLNPTLGDFFLKKEVIAARFIIAPTILLIIFIIGIIVKSKKKTAIKKAST